MQVWYPLKTLNFNFRQVLRINFVKIVDNKYVQIIDVPMKGGQGAEQQQNMHFRKIDK